MPLPGKGRKRFLIVAATVALITFAVTEIGFRVYHNISPIFLFKDAGLRWRTKPFSKKFDFVRNSGGFLDVEYPLKKNPDLFRIVALGDSFATGIVPYQNNFLTLIEDKLNRNKKSVELINMGIHGTSPSDYRSILANESLAYTPDLVLVCFYIGNDFEKSQKRFYEYSYVYMFLKYVAVLAKIPDAFSLKGKKNKKWHKVYMDDRPTYDEAVFLDMELNLIDKYKKGNADFSGKLEEAFGQLLKMYEICRERGIDYRVILIPAEIQVHKEHQDNIVQASGIKRADFDFSAPNRLLTQKLDQAGIKTLDLLEPFIESGKTTRLYRPRDSHWNLAGNELAAEAIKNYLLMAPQIQAKVLTD